MCIGESTAVSEDGEAVGKRKKLVVQSDMCLMEKLVVWFEEAGEEDGACVSVIAKIGYLKVMCYVAVLCGSHFWLR